MTAILTKPGDITGFEDEELIEESVPCSILFRNLVLNTTQNCPRETKYDAVVTCDKFHERTQHYCESCKEKALAGSIDCRTCRTDLKLEATKCPVTVLVLFPRRQR